jgi:hypothetical protein
LRIAKESCAFTCAHNNTAENSNENFFISIARSVLTNVLFERQRMKAGGRIIEEIDLNRHKKTVIARHEAIPRRQSS